MATANTHPSVQLLHPVFEYRSHHPSFLVCSILYRHGDILEGTRFHALPYNEQWQFVGTIHVCSHKHRHSGFRLFGVDDLDVCVQHSGMFLDMCSTPLPLETFQPQFSCLSNNADLSVTFLGRRTTNKIKTVTSRRTRLQLIFQQLKNVFACRRFTTCGVCQQARFHTSCRNVQRANNDGEILLFPFLASIVPQDEVMKACSSVMKARLHICRCCIHPVMRASFHDGSRHLLGKSRHPPVAPSAV